MYISRLFNKPKKEKKPVEVFNEFYVAKSIGAKEHNKLEFTKAAEFYKKALFLKNDDLDLLLRICNCYRRIEKLDLAWKYHEMARELEPESFKVFENEFNLLYEMEDYIGCLRTCDEGRRLFDDAPFFLVGTEKALANIEYKVISDERFDENMINQGRYRDRNAVHRIGGMTNKDIELDAKNKAYPMSSKQSERQNAMARMTRDRNIVQINKYYNLIFKSLECDDFTSARINTELFTDFMVRINHKGMSQVLGRIYNLFGAHQLFVFQDIEKWDEQANHDRAMFFLGQHFVDDPYVLEKSIYGLDIVHAKITIGNLTERLMRARCETEKLYLFLQLAKIYLRKGKRKDLFKTQKYAFKCMKLASEIKNPWWFINALLVTSSAGFQLNQTKRHLKKLQLVVELGERLDIPELSSFAKKLRDITLGINIPKVKPPRFMPHKYAYLMTDSERIQKLGFRMAHVTRRPQLGNNKKAKFRRLVKVLKKKQSNDSTMVF